MKKITEDIRQGIEKIRWFSRLFAERLKIEMAIFKLFYEADKMTRTREALLKKIGERVMELKDNQDKNILKDAAVADAVLDIGKLDTNINDLKNKIAEIGRVME